MQAEFTMKGTRREANILATLVKEKMDEIEKVLRRDSEATHAEKRTAHAHYVELEKLYNDLA